MNILEDLTREVRLEKALIFCDIDGPLLDCEHRLPYLLEKDYDNFYGCAMANDMAHITNILITLPLIEGILQTYGEENVTLVFNTTRPLRTGQLTYLVLKEELPELVQLAKRRSNYGAVKDFMLMRPDKDWGKAGPIKVRNAVNYIKGFYNRELNFDPADTDVFVIDDDYEVLLEFKKNYTHELAKEMTGIDAMQPLLIQVGEKTNSYEQSRSPEE